MGVARQPDDADGDDDDSGIPDRFASPQAPVPFVPPQPAQAQPYAGDRQQPPYGAERVQSGERQPYQDRPYGGERGQGQDRGGYDRSQRPERIGQQRRPFRDDGRPVESRAPDDRPDRRNDRRTGYDRNHERAQQQERFSNERAYREPQAEQPRDIAVGEQPRIEGRDAPTEPQAARAEPALRQESITRTESPSRAEAVSRPTGDDAPGLPSFITTPTRIGAPEAVAVAPVEAGPATVTTFPGDDAAEPPKFPRRRRRPTRAASPDGVETPAEQSAGD